MIGQRHRNPFDPEEAARAAAVEIVEWATDFGFLGLYLRDQGVGVIGLHPLLAAPAHSRLRRIVVAHELGHHHLHAGVHVALQGCTPGTTRTAQVETQAERWAGQALLPLQLVAALAVQRGRLGQEEIAELADWAEVPDAFAAWWTRDLELRGMFKHPVFR